MVNLLVMIFIAFMAVRNVEGGAGIKLELVVLFTAPLELLVSLYAAST